MHFIFIIFILSKQILKLFFSIEKDTSDVAQKMIDLKSQFQRARECIDRLPGTQNSQEEQLRIKSILHQQLLIKTKLLLEYKNNSSFLFNGKNEGEVPSNS